MEQPRPPKALKAKSTAEKATKAKLTAQGKAKADSQSREAELQKTREALAAARSNVLRNGELEAELQKTREALAAARSNVLRKGQWLTQEFSPPTFVPNSSRSGQDRHPQFAPKSVKQWDNFVTEATGYDKEEIIQNARLINNLREMVSLMQVSNSGGTAAAMSMVVLYLGQSYGWTVRPNGKSETNEAVLAESLRNATPDQSENAAINLVQSLEPDLALMDNSKLILPFEMKGVSSHRTQTHRAVNLVTLYNKHLDSKKRRDAITLHCRACIHQLSANIMNSGVGYGVLSSAEYSYFARVTNHGLEISTAVKFHKGKPTLLEALFYVMSKSASELEKGKKYEYNFKGIESDEDGNPEKKKPRLADIRDREKGEKSSPRGTTEKGHFTACFNLQLDAMPYSSEAWSGKIGRGFTDGQEVAIKMPNGHYRIFQDTAASNLQLDEKPYSKGWSGKIGRGVIGGQRVAIKMAIMHTEKAEALLQEVTAYELLRRHWGRFVPALVKCGTTVKGALFFIAIKFVHGSDMSKRAPSQAEWRAAQEALNAIHSCGLLHGDIHEGNIMVEEGGDVQFIDFGFSKLTTNKAERSAEINQLKTLSRQKRISQDDCNNSVTQG